MSYWKIKHDIQKTEQNYADLKNEQLSLATKLAKHEAKRKEIADYQYQYKQLETNLPLYKVVSELLTARKEVEARQSVLAAEIQKTTTTLDKKQAKLVTINGSRKKSRWKQN